VGRLPPICQSWREEAKRRKNRDVDTLTRAGGYPGGGISFQIPKGWSDGKPGLKYVESGQFKGRLRWDSRREAKEIARRISDAQRTPMEYDP